MEATRVYVKTCYRRGPHSRDSSISGSRIGTASSVLMRFNKLSFIILPQTMQNQTPGLFFGVQGSTGSKIQFLQGMSRLLFSGGANPARPQGPHRTALISKHSGGPSCEHCTKMNLLYCTPEGSMIILDPSS